MTVNASIIRQTFAIAKPMLKEIADGFFDRLFTQYPEFKPLFANADMSLMSRSFVSGLSTIVDHLDKQDKMQSYVINLGARHIGYGMKEELFAPFRATLLEALGNFFGDEWPGPISEEWAKFIDLISNLMRQGAKMSIPQAESARKESTMSSAPVATTKNSETYEITLSADLKENIRVAVKQAVSEAVKKEIKKALDAELESLHQQDIISYLKKAG